MIDIITELDAIRRRVQASAVRGSGLTGEEQITASVAAATTQYTTLPEGADK